MVLTALNLSVVSMLQSCKAHRGSGKQKDDTSMVAPGYPGTTPLFTLLLLKSGHEGLLQKLGSSLSQPTISAIVRL